MGHEQGFHEYRDYYGVESFSHLLHATLPIALLDHTIGRKRGAYKFQVDGARITDQIVEWLSSPPGEPYFMWVQYFDPHWPYLPPRETPGVDAKDFDVAGPINGMRGHSQRGINIFHGRKSGITDEQTAAAARLYSGEARYSDQHIGRILDQLGDLDDTIVVVTADHGESLGEHDYHFHHGAFTYDVCLRVPLLVAWPGRVPAGRVVDEPVMTVDILPTLTSLAGLGTPQVDGVVLPGVDGTSSGDPGRVIPFEGDIKLFEANERIRLKGVKGKWRGIVAERHKLIAVPRKKGTDHQFYDLTQDPGEVRDVSDIQNETAARFAEELDAAGLSPGSDFDEAGGGGGYRLDPEEIERLRSLGYLQ
jgi:arylsulfatase A-like enzyme